MLVAPVVGVIDDEHSTCQELADALLASEIENLTKTVLPPGAVGAIRRHMPAAS